MRCRLPSSLLALLGRMVVQPKRKPKPKKKQPSVRGEVPKKAVTKAKKQRSHPKYGTSKLEDDFAKLFLDPLGVEYESQFEAKDIGRFYDFKVKDGPIIEIDGSYFHGDPRLYKEEDLSSMQRHNKLVDEYKNKWALAHGIPILRFWEKDIRENPIQVMSELKERLHIEDEKKVIKEEKGRRHRNKIK